MLAQGIGLAVSCGILHGLWHELSRPIDDDGDQALIAWTFVWSLRHREAATPWRGGLLAF